MHMEQDMEQKWTWSWICRDVDSAHKGPNHDCWQGNAEVCQIGGAELLSKFVDRLVKCFLIDCKHGVEAALE